MIELYGLDKRKLMFSHGDYQFNTQEELFQFMRCSLEDFPNCAIFADTFYGYYAAVNWDGIDLFGIDRGKYKRGDVVEDSINFFSHVDEEFGLFGYLVIKQVDANIYKVVG